MRIGLLRIRRNCAVSSLALAESMLALLSELDSRRKKGTIPRNISKSLLNDLLQIKKCLCGTEFEEGDEIFEHLTKRLAEESSRASGQELLDLLFQIRATNDSIESSSSRLRELFAEYNQLSDHRQELQSCHKSKLQMN